MPSTELSAAVAVREDEAITGFLRKKNQKNLGKIWEIASNSSYKILEVVQIGYEEKGVNSNR